MYFSTHSNLKFTEHICYICFFDLHYIVFIYFFCAIIKDYLQSSQKVKH